MQEDQDTGIVAPTEDSSSNHSYKGNWYP